jgi:hypothetical protein
MSGVGLGAVVVASVVLAIVSLLAPSVPTTDPWGWIVWGRELAHLRLDTVAGPPSWKPLPVLFTMPLSLSGAAAPAAWLMVARAGGALALWLGYRVASGLAGRPAGVVAAAALALSAGWLRGLAHGYSEGLAVALLLAAVECHLAGRRQLALGLGVLVSLSRPEVWPLVAIYGAVIVARNDRTRWSVIVALLAVSPLLWVLPDWWGSGNPLHAGSVARVNLVRAGAHPGIGLLRSGAGLLPTPVWLGAFAGVVLAARRREPTVLVLGLLAGAWIVLEAVATELGYPGSGRFLVLPAALACVLAGVGVVWAAQLVEGRARQIAVAIMLIAALPFAVARIATLPTAARQSVVRARFQLDLRRAVARAGGAHGLLGRGGPVLPDGLWWNAGALAWDLRVPLERITTLSDHRLATLRGVRPPVILFAPLGGTPPDDSKWRPTRHVMRCGLVVTELARAGIWRVLAITHAPTSTKTRGPTAQRCRRPTRTRGAPLTLATASP